MHSEKIVSDKVLYIKDRISQSLYIVRKIFSKKDIGRLRDGRTGLHHAAAP